jgi:hypothetical protein
MSDFDDFLCGVLFDGAGIVDTFDGRCGVAFDDDGDAPLFAGTEAAEPSSSTTLFCLASDETLYKYGKIMMSNRHAAV